MDRPAGYCCGMRWKFIIGITRIRNVQDPPELLQHIVLGAHGPIIYASFCCFCGAKIDADAPREIVPPVPE